MLPSVLWNARGSLHRVRRELTTKVPGQAGGDALSRFQMRWLIHSNQVLDFSICC